MVNSLCLKYVYIQSDLVAILFLNCTSSLRSCQYTRMPAHTPETRAKTRKYVVRDKANNTCHINPQFTLLVSQKVAS